MWVKINGWIFLCKISRFRRGFFSTTSTTLSDVRFRVRFGVRVRFMVRVRFSVRVMVRVRDPSCPVYHSLVFWLGAHGKVVIKISNEKGF